MPSLQSSRAAEGRGPRPYLLACDSGYAAQLATCLLSMVESNRSGWPIDFHVLVENFPENVRRKVFDSLPSGSASINWIDADVTRFAGFATIEHISRMTFARLLIPDVMPAGTTRLVYLDADILVLDDLAPLWDVDLEGQPIGGVVDGLDVNVKANMAGLENVPRVRSYFNAGVLVIDLERWKEERISEKAYEYLVKFPASPYSDQDALNVACDGLWKALDPRWNYQGHLDGRIRDLQPAQSPAVVHFVTPHKPWKPASLNANAALYDSFRRRTLFARTPAQVRADFFETTWFRVRRFLGRFTLLRALRNQLRNISGRQPARRLKAG